MTASYFKYWGKAAKGLGGEGADYHLLVFHSLDVAAVGRLLLDPNKPLCTSLAAQLKVTPEWLREWFCFCLIMHDMGKFFRAFQNLAPNLSDDLVRYLAQYPYKIRHDSLGFALWKKFLSKQLKDIVPPEALNAISPWMEVVCGHHGQPPESRIQTIRPYLAEEDECAAEAFIREVLLAWKPDFEPLTHINKKDFRRVSWRLAGVAVLADWLGSDSEIFKYQDRPQSLTDYWTETALAGAQISLEKSQIEVCEVNPFQSITQQFSFIKEPTPLQSYAQDLKLGNSPQLFILEDVTGAGKTEAAMVLVHKMMSAGLANGLYVGLPTMATANAMYQRMGECYRHLYRESALPSLVLAHGAADLSAEFKQSIMLTEQLTDKSYQPDELSASVYCNRWLADSRKKALLASVGVGTIDQALLAVLPAKHQSLRLLGLMDKVLLVDEVHAYDPYMRKLLIALLEAHAAQGGCAILLSATLPYSFRTELTRAYAQGADYFGEGILEPKLLDTKSYPLVTRLSNVGLSEDPVATRESVRRSVVIQRLGSELEALKVIEKTIAAGQCICWVRNTVGDAFKSYQQLRQLAFVSTEKITLFHSRFAMIDRQTIEVDVLARFGKESVGAQRAGQVLIATQVVEQSLDLDFDVMITDLAPIDLSIQRAGRLQRHVRSLNGNRLTESDAKEERGTPCMYILSPDPGQVNDANWLRQILPGTQAVYLHVGQLWLSIQALLHKGGFKMPEDARELIESVYGQAANDIPEFLEQASNEAEAEHKAEKGMGEFNRLKLQKGYTRASAKESGGWDDDIRIPTRLGIDSVTVVLVKQSEKGWVAYADDLDNAWALSQISLPKKEWQLACDLMSDELKLEIEAFKEKTPSLKWLEILPLFGEIGDCYSLVEGWKGR